MKKIVIFIFLCIIFSACHIDMTGPPEEIEVGKTTTSSTDLALNWLKAKQNKDGTWGEKESKDVLTPLVVLSFISLGENPASVEYGPTVKRGLKALIKRIDDTSRALSEPAKTITIWCFAESYDMTKIPMLETYLSNWLKDEGFDFSSPWTLWAFYSCFVAGVGEEQNIKENLKNCLKSFTKAPETLLNLSLQTYASVRLEKKNYPLYEKLKSMPTEKWKTSKKPMLTAVSLGMIMWDLRQERKWGKEFLTEIWGSQQIEKDKGWWTAKGLGVNTNLAFPDLSKNDEPIYITSMLILSIPPRRRLPIFKIIDDSKEKEDIELIID